jgi:hypothetical protein
MSRIRQAKNSSSYNLKDSKALIVKDLKKICKEHERITDATMSMIEPLRMLSKRVEDLPTTPTRKCLVSVQQVQTTSLKHTASRSFKKKDGKKKTPADTSSSSEECDTESVPKHTTPKRVRSSPIPIPRKNQQN